LPSGGWERLTHAARWQKTVMVRENWADGYPELVDISYRPAVEGVATVALYEMQNSEGDVLLGEVLSYAINPRWLTTMTGGRTMVLWDNWRTLHSAEGVLEDCVREMQRTTIAGDYALGRRLSEFEMRS
jgi:hypothetical protein